MYDVCVIGAGVVGMNIARELSRYDLKICVLEKDYDVSCGCSKANSGIVHGGYSDEPGTLKAKLCVAGNRMYAALDKELNFGYRQTGSVVLAFDDEDLPRLQALLEQGQKNGVEGLEVISGDAVRAIEPHVSPEVKGALRCRHSGVTSPYEFVIALAENAIANGVDIRLEQQVTAIEKTADHFAVHTAAGLTVEARYVINAAGVYSDAIARMVGIDEYEITPRRGQYIIFDKEENYLANTVIFQVPTKLGKGILVTTTFHGNLMIGPNAEEIDDKDDVGTDEKTLNFILQTARKSVPAIQMKKALKSFAGNRPVSNQKDWVIEESPKVKHFINLIGIDSPGLTSSPAIAKEVVGILANAGLSLAANKAFNPYRKPIIVPKDEAFAGDLNATDPTQHIICRCEKVTEAEIIDSLHRGIRVQSLSAVLRRTRAGMGRCQGAFCGPRVKAVVAKELGITPDEVLDRSGASSQLIKRTSRKDLLNLS